MSDEVEVLPDVPDYAAMAREHVERVPHARRTRRADRATLAQVIRDEVGAQKIVAHVAAIMANPTELSHNRLRAAVILLSWGWGRPPQLVHVEASIAAGVEADDAEDVLEEASDSDLRAAVAAADAVRAALGLGSG